MPGADWDALAPYWGWFEDRGFASTALSLIEGGLRPPCLYIGAGLGTFAARLADTLAPGMVVALDASLPMLRQGSTDRRIERVCALAEALPFAAGSFVSAVVATGVLEPGDEAHRTQILDQVAGCVDQHGFVVAAAMIAASDECARDTHDELDRWFHATDSQHPGWNGFDRVAVALGSRVEALALLRRSFPRNEPTLAVDSIANAASAAGLVVTAQLEVTPAGAPRLTLYRLERGR